MANLTRAYSPAEIAILRAEAAKGSGFIAMKIDRSTHSIANKAAELGISLGRQAHAPHSWTEERIALLRDLWAKGDAASAIAARLGGVTRSGVIGKAHRLGLPARQPGFNAVRTGVVDANKPRAPRKPAAPKPRKATGQVLSVHTGGMLRLPANDDQMAHAHTNFQRALAATTQVGAEGVDLIALTPHQCCWPLTTPDGTHRFCGAVRATSTGGERAPPYCAEHAALAVNADSARIVRSEMRSAMRCAGIKPDARAAGARA